MKKYNNLLNRVSEEYSITKGITEDENQWKIRIIYSILGKMALASLCDTAEDGTSSIIHMKHKIETISVHYKEMFPELDLLMPITFEDLSNEIYDIYLKTGVIYHEPNRLIMATKSEAVTNGVRFTRGFEVDAKQMISGLGTYTKFSLPTTNNTLSDMFLLETHTLIERWQRCVECANWQEYHSEISAEYLRMVPPFRYGYWVDKPCSDGKVSLLRTGYKGSQLYYLYKIENERVMISQLPQWQIEDYAYRSLANACLCKENVLPPSTYRYDGDLVYLHFGYLPPPAELYLWKLYTWPFSITNLPSDFCRICNRTTFEAIRNVIQHQGYEFIEE